MVRERVERARLDLQMGVSSTAREEGLEVGGSGKGGGVEVSE